jgi:hypothetical protein
MSRMFERFGGACAVLAGVTGFGYSAAFVVYLEDGSRGAAYVDAVLLLAGGLLSAVAFLAVYGRVRRIDEGFALLGLAAALAASYGAMTHGAFDLANLLKPPKVLASDLPSSTDPRGLGTFALAAVAMIIVGALGLRGRALPVRLAYLAFVGAGLLLIVYIGRLVILDPHSPVLHTAAVIDGFIVNPAWFIWVGRTLLRTAGERQQAGSSERSAQHTEGGMGLLAVRE